MDIAMASGEKILCRVDGCGLRGCAVSPEFVNISKWLYFFIGKIKTSCMNVDPSAHAIKHP